MNQWDREFQDKPGFFETPKGPIIVVGSVLVLGVVFLLFRSLGSSEAPQPAVAEQPKSKPAEMDPAPAAKVEPQQLPPPELKQPQGVLPAVPIPEESDVVEWTALADPFAEDKPAPGLTAAHLKGIKLSITPRTLGADPALKVAAIGGADDAGVVWDLQSHKRLSTFEVPGEKIAAVAALSPERVIVWGSESGLMQFAADSGKPESRLAIPTEGGHPECGLAVSPGGKFLALVRKGIRIYDTTEFKFSGLIPLPNGQQVLAFCFHPQGDKLLVVYDTQDRLQYRLAIYELPTGQESAASRPLRAGSLRHAAVSGLLTPRVNEQNRMYLFLGARAVLSEEDGRLLWLNQRPPAFAMPLESGRLWIADGKDAQMSQMDWDKMESTVRKFDFNREVSQINPDIKARIKVEVGSVATNSKPAVTAKLKGYLENWLAGQEMGTEGSADATLIVKYSERTGGRLTSLRVRGANGQETTKPADGKLTEPEVEVTWHHDVLDMDLWQKKVRVRASDVVCAPGQEGTAGFAAAALDQTLVELGEVGIPYFVVKSLVGSKNEELPLVVSHLR